MQLDQIQIKKFAASVQGFLDALRLSAAQNLEASLPLLEVRFILEQHLTELKQGLLADHEQEVVEAIFSITSAASPMSEQGVDIDHPPLEAAWRNVMDSVAPLLAKLAGE